MADIDPKTRQRLEKHWLPHVRQLKQDRKPMFWLMVAVLVAPLIMVLILVLFQIFVLKDLDAAASAVSVTLLGVSALSFKYLGKLQSCNDAIAIIEYAVLLGDRQNLHKAVSNLTCLGKFRGIISDVQHFI